MNKRTRYIDGTSDSLSFEIGTVTTGINPSVTVNSTSYTNKFTLNFVLPENQPSPPSPPSLPNYLGNWNQSILYKFNDIVLFNGSSYVCLRNLNQQPTQNPSNDTYNWQLIASKGDVSDINNSITLLNTITDALANPDRITRIETKNTEQDNRLRSIESSAIYSITAETPTVNTLTSGSNATVTLSIGSVVNQPNTKKISFTFGIPRGATGTDGTNGISFIWKGEWNNNNGTIYYFKNDVSQYEGSSWICLGNKDNRNLGTNSNTTPKDNTAEWQLLAKKGDTGDKGDKGDKGEKGDSGQSGLDALLTAIGLGVLIGASAVEILRGLLSITENATDLRNDIDGLDQDIDTANQRIAQLENKTQNQSALSLRTTFKNVVGIENVATLQDTIEMDGSIGKIKALFCEITNGDFNNINLNNSLYAAENATVLGNVNLGSAFTSTVNINSLNTNINGILTINGTPYVPFNPTNFFVQW